MLGEVVIRIGCRVVSDRDGFFEKRMMDLFQEKEGLTFWPKDGDFVGPFCFMPSEIECPF